MTTTPSLVGVAEISALLGVPRSTVSMWDARRRTNGFPAPVENLAMGPVYEWPAVKAWHEGRKVSAGQVVTS